MDFASVFKFLIKNLQREKIDFALIGGFALQASGITRTTKDVDLIILGENAPKVKKIMLAHEYQLLHESKEISNYLGKSIELGRVDFLYAHRKYSRAMLKRATFRDIFAGQFRVKVLKIEDLIGLKIQASTNDPERYHQDMSDIEFLVERYYKRLNLDSIKEYFILFNREKELQNILKKIDAKQRGKKRNS